MSDVKPGPGTRRSTLRAERAQVTRRRIADAARRMFGRDGYATTTLAGIASEAGVAVQTVYAVYGSKAGILAALRESVVDQPEAEALYAEAMVADAAPRRVELFARSMRRRWELSGDVVEIHRDAGTADQRIRAAVVATLERRRSGIRALAATLEPALGKGVDVARAAAVLDALTLHEVYAELVGVHGWTPDAYEAWLAATLTRELLGSS